MNCGTPDTYLQWKHLERISHLANGLGCDWFQPYKHVNYSVGALYIFFYNLLREERMKFENFVLLGLIPGPSEPKKAMNSYLDPFVNNMLQLWEGVPKQLIPIRMASLFVMCDIPATIESFVALLVTVQHLVVLSV